MNVRGKIDVIDPGCAGGASAGEDSGLLLRKLVVGQNPLLVQLAELLELLEGIRADPTGTRRRCGRRRCLLSALESADPVVLVGLALLSLGAALAGHVRAASHGGGTQQGTAAT